MPSTQRRVPSGHERKSSILYLHSPTVWPMSHRPDARGPLNPGLPHLQTPETSCNSWTEIEAINKPRGAEGCIESVYKERKLHVRPPSLLSTPRKVPSGHGGKSSIVYLHGPSVQPMSHSPDARGPPLSRIPSMTPHSNFNV